MENKEIANRISSVILTIDKMMKNDAISVKGVWGMQNFAGCIGVLQEIVETIGAKDESDKNEQ